jgi:hypothetical protein
LLSIISVIYMKKFLLGFFLMVLMMCSFGAVNYPARTNGNNTFFGTNYHSLPIVANGGVVVAGTNGVTSSGSAVSGMTVTNGTATVSQQINVPRVNSSDWVTAPGELKGGWMTVSTYGYSQMDNTVRIKRHGGTTPYLITFNATNGIITGNGLQLAGVAAEPAAVAGYAQIYAATNATVTELYVQGSDGLETQISPHADDAPIELYDRQASDMKEIIWRERSPFVMKSGTNVGQVSFINLRRMARLTELNTKGILFLAGKTSAGNSNALEKLKDMTNAERQVIMTESYAEHNARTGRSLVPKTWEGWQTELQEAYDADRIRLAAEAAAALATNAVLTAEGRTNELWTVPVVPEARDVRQPKPGWLW